MKPDIRYLGEKSAAKAGNMLVFAYRRWCRHQSHWVQSSERESSSIAIGLFTYYQSDRGAGVGTPPCRRCTT
jgi:hypothetical protein